MLNYDLTIIYILYKWCLYAGNMLDWNSLSFMFVSRTELFKLDYQYRCLESFPDYWIVRSLRQVFFCLVCLSVCLSIYVCCIIVIPHIIPLRSQSVCNVSTPPPPLQNWDPSMINKEDIRTEIANYFCLSCSQLT